MKRLLCMLMLVISSVQVVSVNASVTPLQRFFGCSFLTTLGLYALINAKSNYDSTQGLAGVAHKGLEKSAHLLNKAQHTLDDTKPSDEEKLYIRYSYWEKFPIKAALWGGLGLAALIASYRVYNYEGTGS